MASKDSRNISGFPRRILSSLRRNRKAGNAGTKNAGQLNQSGFTPYDLENTQNEISIINFETDPPLHSPRKQEKLKRTGTNNDLQQVDENTSLLSQIDTQSYSVLNDDVSVLESVPHELFRNLSAPSVRRVDQLVHPQVNSTPNARRIELGGSADSGIDCSLLMSEKSSPEQFVSFTRREAERLRQEQQILGFNESQLEPVNEVDSRSSSDNENVVKDSSEDLNNSQLEKVEGLNNDKDANVQDQRNTASSYIETPSSETDGINETLALLQSDNDDQLSENTDTEPPLVCPTPLPHNSFRDCGDYVTLKEQTEPVNAMHSNNETLVARSRTLNTSLTSSQFHNHSLDNVLMNIHANKTDETKSAEARLLVQQQMSANDNFSSVAEIVDPIPVVSPQIATHKVLPQTISPARLFVNENSAFARCKSIKRTVSDASKGFFGRFRHRSKDSVSSQEDAASISSSVSDSKDSKALVHKLSKKSKKFSVRKHKAKLFNSSNEQIDLEQVEMVDMNHTERRNHKPPKAKKEQVSSKRVRHDAPSQSPVMKEVLSDDEKDKVTGILASRLSVEVESIEDITQSICNMTSALHASSAESIDCICGCKDRNSNAECCEKRKTPTPPLNTCSSNTHLYELDTGGLTIGESEQTWTAVDDPCDTENSQDVNERQSLLTRGSQLLSDKPYSETGQVCKPSARDLNKVPAMSDLCWDECSDTCSDDESQCSCSCQGDSCHGGSDSSTQDSSGENEDDVLDCSHMCIASPQTGKMLLSDDNSSDDETGSSPSSSSSFSSGSYKQTLPRKGANQNGIELDLDSSIQSFNLMQEIDTHVGNKNTSVLMQQTFSAFPEQGEGSEEDRNCDNDKDGVFNSDQQVSPYSVNFQEVNFDNGEVMYMENSNSDDFKDLWNPTKARPDFQRKSHLIETPMSSPKVQGKHETESDSPLVNYPINPRVNESMNMNLSLQDQSGNRQTKVSESHLSKTSVDINVSQDASFTNVSFEGSFAECSYSVRKYHETLRLKDPRSSECDFNDSCAFNSDAYELDSSVSNPSSYNAANHSFSHQQSNKRDKNNRLNSTFNGASQHENDLRKQALRRAHSVMHSPSTSFSRNNPYYASFHGNSPCPSPLDLSVNKGRQPQQQREMENSFTQGRQFQSPMKHSKAPDHISNAKYNKWMDHHVGQVYSPAKRALHKNRGVSESDLCKEILNLYVSDVDESGFEVLDETMNTSVRTLAENSSSSLQDRESSLEQSSSLQFGTYVAPQHVVKETNVDDFTTKTVWKCYTGEARTRKLQGGNNSLICGNDRRMAAEEELANMSLPLDSRRRGYSLNDSCPTISGLDSSMIDRPRSRGRRGYNLNDSCPAISGHDSNIMARPPSRRRRDHRLNNSYAGTSSRSKYDAGGNYHESMQNSSLNDTGRSQRRRRKNLIDSESVEGRRRLSLNDSLNLNKQRSRSNGVRRSSGDQESSLNGSMRASDMNGSFNICEDEDSILEAGAPDVTRALRHSALRDKTNTHRLLAWLAILVTVPCKKTSLRLREGLSTIW
ncbi:hypothetical protein MAR_007532 [Mya arenaria]|uniref:Uncharacterized protein n=1 Tax=Mya arenaria TaxID=6604 RepID=A0ABY7DEL6_MYAAR|nr:hypothetical protein MAR_007532 [Mya arenaria]